MLGLCFSYDFQFVPTFGGPSLTVTEVLGELGSARHSRERGELGVRKFRSDEREQPAELLVLPSLALAIFGEALPPVSESRRVGGLLQTTAGKKPAAFQCWSAEKAAGNVGEHGKV